MTWSYQYTPNLWPVITSTIFLATLGIYGFRRHAVPGGLALGVLMAIGALWSLAHGLQLSGVNDEIKILWFKLQIALMLPMATAALCFVLDYAGLTRWLAFPAMGFLTTLPLVFVLLILTNESHHLVWTQIWLDGAVHVEKGLAHWAAIIYGIFIGLLQFMVLVWLFLRSPRHRWIVLWLILSLVSVRCAVFMDMTNNNPFAPLSLVVFVLNFALFPYFLAIVGFHMFDVTPIARDAAVECMADGLLVLDSQNRIADVNKTVQTLLGVTRSKIMGIQIEKALAAFPGLLKLIENSAETNREVVLGASDARFHYVSISPIVDRRSFQLGRIVTLHDVTEQKRFQAKILDQERALAMLRERELLARDLHDGIGQIAAAAHLQVKCASEFLARGEAARVETCLKSVSDATQEIKEAVRDYLSGVKTSPCPQQGFVTGIRCYVDEYARKHGVKTELTISPELEGLRLDSCVEAQLQPIVQEALTNVRKHSRARSARVAFTPLGNRVRVTIEDDGQGFDPESLEAGRGFGLRSMRGRTEALGGRMEVKSAPGGGAIVSIEIPLRREEQ